MKQSLPNEILRHRGYLPYVPLLHSIPAVCNDHGNCCDDDKTNDNVFNMVDQVRKRVTQQVSRHYHSHYPTDCPDYIEYEEFLKGNPDHAGENGNKRANNRQKASQDKGH